MPEGWRRLPLEEVAVLEMGETLIAKDLTNDGIPVFSAGKAVAPWGFTSQSKRVLPRGTIVIGARGTIGYPRLPPFDRFICTQTTIAVRPSSAVEPAFLKFALDQVDYSKVTAQQAVPMLTIGALRDVAVVLPPLPEQRRIAAVLTSVDDAIEATQAVIEQVQTVKKALLGELLSRGLPGRHRRFKETEIGQVPEEWGMSSLNELCRARQWPTISKSELTSEGFPVYGANGIIGRSREYNHEHPTIAITCRGATCGTINVTVPRSYITGNAMSLDELDESRVKLGFLARWLEHFGVDVAITGSAQPQITRGTLEAIRVAVPSLDEQVALVEAFDCVQSRLELELAELEARVRLKTSLLSTLLSGEVRVTPGQAA